MYSKTSYCRPGMQYPFFLWDRGRYTLSALSSGGFWEEQNKKSSEREKRNAEGSGRIEFFSAGKI